MRFGPGPVFIYECLSGSRRWQTYALRALGAAVLLAAITTIATSRSRGDHLQSWRDTRRWARRTSTRSSASR